MVQNEGKGEVKDVGWSTDDMVEVPYTNERAALANTYTTGWLEIKLLTQRHRQGSTPQL